MFPCLKSLILIDAYDPTREAVYLEDLIFSGDAWSHVSALLMGTPVLEELSITCNLLLFEQLNFTSSTPSEGSHRPWERA